MTKEEVLRELDSLRLETTDTRLYRVIVEAKRLLEEEE